MMLRWSLGFILLSATLVAAQERLLLDSAVYVSPGVQRFRVRSLLIQRGTPTNATGTLINEGPKLIATFMETDTVGVFVPDGKTLQCIYLGAQAETILVALNKADLSSISLERRVINRCQTDGRIGPGVIQGTPQ